jgi:hypothetical protein
MWEAAGPLRREEALLQPSTGAAVLQQQGVAGRGGWRRNFLAGGEGLRWLEYRS